MDRIFLTRADLKHRGITISNSTLLWREAKGEFPKRTYLTHKTVIWNRAEIDEFLEGLYRARAKQMECYSNARPNTCPMRGTIMAC